MLMKQDYSGSVLYGIDTRHQRAETTGGRSAMEEQTEAAQRGHGQCAWTSLLNVLGFEM